MNNGNINQIGHSTRDIPQVLGKQICAHKTKNKQGAKAQGP